MAIRSTKKVEEIILISNVNEASNPKIKVHKKSKHLNPTSIKIEITPIKKWLQIKIS